MRIIGGAFKSRIFRPAKNFKARPTTDFARENLFNILHNRYDLETKKVLDLFSGTGSISFEFVYDTPQTQIKGDFPNLSHKLISAPASNNSLTNETCPLLQA